MNNNAFKVLLRELEAKHLFKCGKRHLYEKRVYGRSRPVLPEHRSAYNGRIEMLNSTNPFHNPSKSLRCTVSEMFRSLISTEYATQPCILVLTLTQSRYELSNLLSTVLLPMNFSQSKYIAIIYKAQSLDAKTTKSKMSCGRATGLHLFADSFQQTIMLSLCL